MEFTGEQFVPGITKKRLVDEHIERYNFANKYAKDAKILDIACGTGYGAFELSKISSEVIGVDISDESINFAKQNYQNKNLNFILASGTDNLFNESSFDLICCFETIEHLTSEQRKIFLNNLHHWLKPEGVLLLSTPNKVITSPDTVTPQNKFHVIEFTKNELLDELKPFFLVKDSLGQRIVHRFFTVRIVRKFIFALQKISGHNFHIYDLANGSIISSYNKNYEPRIFFFVLKPIK